MSHTTKEFLIPTIKNEACSFNKDLIATIKEEACSFNKDLVAIIKEEACSFTIDLVAKPSGHSRVACIESVIANKGGWIEKICSSLIVLIQGNFLYKEINASKNRVFYRAILL